MVRDVPYPGEIPQALAHLHAWLEDSGHSIMAVPKVFLDKARKEGCWLYEVPLPVRYVLAAGWEPIEGTDGIAVDVPYDSMMGAMVPDREAYEEF